jgi:hypothetical protein
MREERIGESKIPIFVYVDESGNTGKNIFDPAQPDFFTAALVSKGDFDAVWGDRSGSQERLCDGSGSDLEAEHDGREPNVDDEPSIGYDVEPAEEDTGNDEPSLGWTDEEAARGRTYAGSCGNSTDCEQGELARKPQNRSSIEREPITVEVSYRRFLRGLTPEQRKRVKATRQRGVGNDVIIA